MAPSSDAVAVTTPGAAAATASATSDLNENNRTLAIVAAVVGIIGFSLSLVTLVAAFLLRDYVERTGRAWEREHAATEKRIEAARQAWTNDLFAVSQANLAEQRRTQDAFKDYRTQEWLKERRLMDHEAYMIVNGQKRITDDDFGPTGNLTRMKAEK